MRKHLSKASKTKEENLIVQAEPATPNSPLKEINRRVRKNKNKRNGKSHTGKTIHRVVIKLCLSRQAAPWRHPPPPLPRRDAVRTCVLLVSTIHDPTQPKQNPNALIRNHISLHAYYRTAEDAAQSISHRITLPLNTYLFFFTAAFLCSKTNCAAACLNFCPFLIDFYRRQYDFC